MEIIHAYILFRRRKEENIERILVLGAENHDGEGASLRSLCEKLCVLCGKKLTAKDAKFFAKVEP